MRYLLAVVTLVMAAVPGTGPANEQPEPVNAVATIGMIRDVVANVGGDCVAAEGMMGPGVDPHLYRASAGDVKMLRDAEVIFYAGYALEGRLGRVFDRLSQRIPTVAVSEAAHDREALISVADYDGVDPHLWMDVALWSGTVPVIADALVERRPACEARIRENAAAYREQLMALDAWIRDAVATVPEAHRHLVTAHDAFEYFGRAYDLAVVGIQGISTDSEPSIQDIRATADRVVDTGVPAIFVESTISPRTVEAVIEATRQRGHEVRIGGELYSDAMGARDEAAGTYIGMMHANTRTVVEALGGDPPGLPDALSDWARAWEVE